MAIPVSVLLLPTWHVTVLVVLKQRIPKKVGPFSHPWLMKQHPTELHNWRFPMAVGTSISRFQDTAAKTWSERFISTTFFWGEHRWAVKNTTFPVMKIDSCWWQHVCFRFTFRLFFFCGWTHICFKGHLGEKPHEHRGKFIPFWGVSSWGFPGYDCCCVYRGMKFLPSYGYFGDSFMKSRSRSLNQTVQLMVHVIYDLYISGLKFEVA